MSQKPRASKESPQHKQEDRRQHLLASATAVFAAKSFEGSTVKDIAEHAEMNVAMVSYYFDNKEGLYQACLESLARDRFKILDKMLTAPTSAEDFRAKMRLFVESCIQDQIDQPQVTRMIQNEIHQGLPYARAVFKDTFLRVFETFVQFLEHGKKAKFVHPQCDCQLNAMFIQGALMNLAGTEKLRKEFFGISMDDLKTRNKITDQFVNLILDGTTRRGAS